MHQAKPIQLRAPLVDLAEQAAQVAPTRSQVSR